VAPGTRRGIVKNFVAQYCNLVLYALYLFNKHNALGHCSDKQAETYDRRSKIVDHMLHEAKRLTVLWVKLTIMDHFVNTLSALKENFIV